MNEVMDEEGILLKLNFANSCLVNNKLERLLQKPHPSAGHEDQTQFFFLLPCLTHLFSCKDLCQVKLNAKKIPLQHNIVMLSRSAFHDTKQPYHLAAGFVP